MRRAAAYGKTGGEDAGRRRKIGNYLHALWSFPQTIDSPVATLHSVRFHTNPGAKPPLWRQAKNCMRVLR
jgi:hypothetical protein